MAAPNPTPNCRSQLDRAVVAYLIGLEVGTSSQIFPAHSASTKPLPNLAVKSADSRCDTQPVSFIEAFDVQLIARQSSANAKGETNPENKRVILDNLLGRAMTVMTPDDTHSDFSTICAAITAAGRALATDNDATVAANNQDMSQFTVMFMAYRGTTFMEPDGQTGVYAEIRHFEVHACPKALTV